MFRYEGLIAKASPEDKMILEKLRASVFHTSDLSSFSSVLSNSSLANAMAVSVLVQDINGNYGLVRRTSNLAIGSRLLSVTSTGSLDDSDFHSDNPVIACATRELREELNITCTELILSGIAISKKKLQPILMVNGKINCTWEAIMNTITTAEDYNAEVQEFIAVPHSAVAEFIANENLTDAGRYHILYQCHNER